jgi:hypothetical protein
MWPESSTITIPPQDSANVKINLVLPTNIQTGVYQGFLKFESDKHTVNSPVSFVVKQPVNQKDVPILGAFDMANRYMAGDWRQYYFDIKDESINSAAIEFSWITDDTNLSVFVMNPKGEIIQTNMPSGIFGHFLGWVSLDWLGSSVFSQGGGFFPVKNKDNTSTVIYVPINQTGTYSILAHSTLFGGNSTTEPITLAAKFSTISADVQSELNELNQTKIQPEIILPNKTKTIPDVISDTNSNKSLIIEKPKEFKDVLSEDLPSITQQEDSKEISFPIELVIGIGIGIAIGLAFVFITRRNSDK